MYMDMMDDMDVGVRCEMLGEGGVGKNKESYTIKGEKAIGRNSKMGYVKMSACKQIITTTYMAIYWVADKL